MPRAWYAYNGVSDPYLFTSYSLSNGTPGCIDGNDPCAIFVYNGGSIPEGSFSANIRIYIADLMVTSLAQPQLPSNTKKYVYGITS